MHTANVCAKVKHSRHKINTLHFNSRHICKEVVDAESFNSLLPFAKSDFCAGMCNLQPRFSKLRKLLLEEV